MLATELTNFTVWGKQWFADGWEGLRAFCGVHGIAGVELLGSGATADAAPPVDLIHGVHLRSLGGWLPLAGLPVDDFGEGSRRYRLACTYAELVAIRAGELREVAAFEPAYVVWHGCYAPPGLVLAGRGELSDEEFLQRLATLVRAVLRESPPSFTVCFENALGVGVGPDSLDATAEFLAALSDLPVGLVLDTGHHLNQHRDIASPEAACRELLRVGEEFERRALPVHVLHLHWTPPELAPVTAPEAGTPGRFFQESDRHLPLAHPLLAEAVEALAPKYIVHELGAVSLHDHAAWLAQQAAALRRTSECPGH